MTAAKYTLRLLRGIAEIEDRFIKCLAHENPLWAPEYDGLDEELDRVSRLLFGITGEEVEERSAEPHLREKFSAALQPFVDAEEAQGGDDGADKAALIALWTAHGWDVTDGDGETLHCLYDFSFQMAVATLGLLGRLPDAERPAAELEGEAEAWAKNVLGKATRRPPRGGK